MNQNEKLIKNMRNFDESQNSPVEIYKREMSILAGTLEKRKEFKNIINTLNPTQNGKRK